MFAVTLLDSGIIQMRSPMTMPDGDIIDVYWHDGKITDLSETYGWLSTSIGLDELSDTQKTIFDEACMTYGVQQLGKTLSISINDKKIGNVTEAATRLVQAIAAITFAVDLDFRWRYGSVQEIFYR